MYGTVSCFIAQCTARVDLAHVLPAVLPVRIRSVLEARLVEEEVSRRVSELVESRVSLVLQSDLVQRQLSERLDRERAAIGEQVRAGVCGVGGGYTLGG